MATSADPNDAERVAALLGREPQGTFEVIVRDAVGRAPGAAQQPGDVQRAADAHALLAGRQGRPAPGEPAGGRRRGSCRRSCDPGRRGRGRAPAVRGGARRRDAARAHRPAPVGRGRRHPGGREVPARALRIPPRRRRRSGGQMGCRPTRRGRPPTTRRRHDHVAHLPHGWTCRVRRPRGRSAVHGARRHDHACGHDRGRPAVARGAHQRDRNLHGSHRRRARAKYPAPPSPMSSRFADPGCRPSSTPRWATPRGCRSTSVATLPKKCSARWRPRRRPIGRSTRVCRPTRCTTCSACAALSSPCFAALQASELVVIADSVAE